MSTVPEQFVALMSTVSPNGAYPLVAKATAAYPYVVYQRVVSVVENVLTGNGNPPIENTRLQVDSWGQTYAEAVTLSAAVATAMRGWALQNVLLFSQDDYDEEAKAYRVIQDYSIYSPT